ncbi:lysoplasmalogenase [Arthrobacter sp. MYb222]|uniref:lysoplasmalogenase n=1 Tax=Arthrobacter sp. MYb222 TaxID=1848599 RepID=UPI001C614A05|nr:lysoplasmalogenase [Arthrobacter sp. MYb222]
MQPHLGNEHTVAVIPGQSRRGIAALALLLATATHLLAQLLWPSGLLADATQILLMPLLAGTVLALTTSPRGTLVRLVLIALFFSWVGDTLPRFMDGDSAFLAMVSAFLVAQFFYIAALARYWKSSILRHWWMPLPYLAAFALLLVLCSPGAGVLLAPVIIYGLALMMMAILSTGLGPIAGFGGAIFFLSDSLIALRSFADIDVPGMGFWIMLTYVAGQWMISYAASQREAQEKSTVKCE